RQPRIAIYGFFQNDFTTMMRFLNSAREADEIVLCDAGSSDDTGKIIGEFRQASPVTKLSVYRSCVPPWRYDDARNTALALVSSDIDLCIPLCPNEYLMPGWKMKLLRHWDPGTTRYLHPVRMIRSDGRPSTDSQGSIHARAG